MTVKSKVESHILKNPNLSNAETAVACGTTKGNVMTIKHNMRKEGKLPKLPKGWNRKQVDPHTALAEECETAGVPVGAVSHYWYKGEHFSIFSKTKQIDFNTIANDLTEVMRNYSPVYPAVKYPKIKEGHLLVIDPADIHMGKLCRAFETGDEYNHRIARERVKAGVTGILQKAQGWPIEKIIFIIGNDILHVDNAKSSTTSGTPQDTDLMWYDAFNMALELYVEVLEMLSTVAPVHVQYDPSNHDYLTGFFLANTLKAWFRKHKGVTMNVSVSHRKYSVYGKNLIGSTHGDGAKEADLPMLMAHEAKEHWNHCVHRYFYTHHIHHKKSKDYMSVCVESLRSPSGTDSWHHRNGYQHAPKAIEGYIHHPEFGQVARLTHLF